MIPPINGVTEWFVVRRPVRGDTLVFLLDNGDDYECTREEAETFLRLLGEPDGFNLLDYVWNFYAAVVELNGGDWLLKSTTPQHAEKLTEPVLNVVF